MLSCPNFSQVKVIVIGDAMLDRYWHGDTSRISPEAPVPVVKIDHFEERVGGAANVAVNVRTLGADTTLIACIGEDDAGAKLSKMLMEQGVNCRFIKSKEANTTLKLRVLGRNQQLIRLDFEDKFAVSAQSIIEQLEQVIDGADIVILSDYAKGVLQDPQTLIAYIREKGIKILVDPKNPDLSGYRGATALTPNLGEFEAMVGRVSSESAIEEKGLELLEKLELESLLVTRGSHGMSLIQSGKPAIHIPAQAREVFDITGAGDTVIAVLGASIACGVSYTHAAQIANIAAGLSVAKLGTATITPQEIEARISLSRANPQRGILPLNDLLNEIKSRKARGDKIVLTNGCFDILHAGHVTYLQQARALGDCLIMAVNDDDSVRRLKGKTRPINPLAERMQVLAALACVDYVVPFSEDTPEALIKLITPHILTKGGDYNPDQIAGAKHVVQNGGSVEILPFVPGCSTTGMVERMAVEKEAVKEIV